MLFKIKLKDSKQIKLNCKQINCYSNQTLHRQYNTSETTGVKYINMAHHIGQKR